MRTVSFRPCAVQFQVSTALAGKYPVGGVWRGSLDASILTFGTHILGRSLLCHRRSAGTIRRCGLPTSLDRFSPEMLAVLRIVTALIFMKHGTQKLLGFPPGSTPQPPLFSMLGFAGVLEVVGGTLILLGLYTRPVAFILAGQMAVAYFMGHAQKVCSRPITGVTRRFSTASSSSTSCLLALELGASKGTTLISN